MLFDSGKFKLSEPKNMNPEERQKKAKEQFEPWFESANLFLDGFEFYFLKGENNFIKSCIRTSPSHRKILCRILLVFTDYKPKIHDIEKLGNQV
jgi:hypothetical protein